MLTQKMLHVIMEHFLNGDIINEFTDTDKPSSFSVIIANPHAVGESISLHTTCHKIFVDHKRIP